MIVLFYIVLALLLLTSVYLFHQLSLAQEETRLSLPRKPIPEPIPGLSRREIRKILRNLEIKDTKKFIY